MHTSNQGSNYYINYTQLHFDDIYYTNTVYQRHLDSFLESWDIFLVSVQLRHFQAILGQSLHLKGYMPVFKDLLSREQLPMNLLPCRANI